MGRARDRGGQDVRTGRIDELRQRYSLGRDTARKLAQEAGAVIRINGVCLYDFDKIDKYLSKQAGR